MSDIAAELAAALERFTTRTHLDLCSRPGECDLAFGARVLLAYDQHQISAWNWRRHLTIAVKTTDTVISLASLPEEDPRHRTIEIQGQGPDFPPEVVFVKDTYISHSGDWDCAVTRGWGATRAVAHLAGCYWRFIPDRPTSGAGEAEPAP